MNDNKTNAPIKLPVRIDQSDGEPPILVDADGLYVNLDRTVVALNEADALRAEVAEFKSIEWLLSRRPIFDDCKTTYDKVAKMLSVCGQADKILANFAQNAIKPKDAETSQEKAAR